MSDLDIVKAIEELSGRVENIGRALTEASTAIEGLQDCKNFPVDRDTAVTAINELTMVAGVPTISILNEIGRFTEAQAKTIFLTSWIEADRPITAEGLVNINSWLPTNKGTVYSYLDPFKFAKSVHEAESVQTFVETIDPEKYMHVDSTEMHAREVLTRTFAYVKSLVDIGEDDWVWSAFRIGCEVADLLEKGFHTRLVDMQETIASSAMQELAIATITNPATQEQYIACVESMMNCLREMHRFNALLGKVATFYKSLHDCLVKTRDAMGEAYGCYLNDNAISF